MLSEDIQLNIESEAFENMRTDFDTILKRTLQNLTEKGSSEATVNVKLTVKLDDYPVPQAAHNSFAKTYKRPSFQHKIGSVLQIKMQEAGKFDGEYELVWDSDVQDYVLRKVVNGQTSVFDADYYAETSKNENGSGSNEDAYNDSRALPLPTRLLEEADEDDSYPYDDNENEEPGSSHADY